MQSHYFGCRITPPNPDIWTRLEIDAPLANAVGGEGGIFNVKAAGPLRRVAKIYNDDAKATLGPDAFKALAFLTSKYSEFSRAMPFVAWPIEVLFSEERPLAIDHLKALAGITMRRIDGHTTLEKLTTNGTGRVGLGNEPAVRIAATIAGQLKKLHQHGIIFCDFNPRNVLVSHDKRSVAFVDADAFQHGFAHQVFTKAHYTRGYASKDHLENKPGARTPADDNFVLAIHIFQLLTDGGHPFKSGANYAPPNASLFDSVTEDDNIKERRWPYSNVALYQPPGQTPQHYARLHSDIKAMFVRAFERFDPPTAEEWENLLPRFRDNVDDPGTRHSAPNPNAISRPQQYSRPPAASPQPAPHRPNTLHRSTYALPSPPTVIVPPMPDPVPPTPLMRALLALRATASFIALLFHALRGGPFATAIFLAQVLWVAITHPVQSAKIVFKAGMATAVLVLFINVVVPQKPTRQQSTLATYSVPTKPKVQQSAVQPQKPQRKPAAEPEVLPWKANVTPSKTPKELRWAEITDEQNVTRTYSVFEPGKPRRTVIMGLRQATAIKESATAIVKPYDPKEHNDTYESLMRKAKQAEDAGEPLTWQNFRERAQRAKQESAARSADIERGRTQYRYEPNKNQPEKPAGWTSNGNGGDFRLWEGADPLFSIRTKSSSNVR